jgi:hypothetical protein
MWLIAGIGFLASLFGIFIGFLPPSQIEMGNYTNYLLFLFIGIALFCVAPITMYHFSKAKEATKS